MGYRPPCLLAILVLAVGCGGNVEQGGSGGSPNGGTGGAAASCNGFTDCCTQGCGDQLKCVY